MTHRVKLSAALRPEAKKQINCRPLSFAFCERGSGAVRFRVEAEPDGSLPVERVAGLLAMHCLVGGLSPEDFEVMVVTQESFLGAVAERTAQLLAAGRAIGTRVRVSRREKEVLDGVLRNLANKEIASQLNVSERTIKFHVSSLLAKFNVSDRIALCREVIMGRVSATLPESNFSESAPFTYPLRRSDQQENGREPQKPDESSRRNSVFTMTPAQRYA